MTMGTASTMTALSEALGMTLPGASSIPAADSNHVRLAMDTGRRIVEMVWEDLKPADILTLAAFRNAITVDMAIGGSTNAIIHLVALARRLRLRSAAYASSTKSRAHVPVLANIRPSGEFLMEDFYYAGGLRALMAEIRDLLDLDCLTVNGKTIGENLEGARVMNRNVIRERAKPALRNPAAPRSSTAPSRRMARSSRPVAADPRFWQHTGPAVVFQDYDDMEARINRDDLDVDENSVLVLQNAGPAGRPGHAGVGHASDSRKAAEARRARHGAHLRCAHERHGLRHLRPARFAGELRRRPAGAGPRWRPDLARHPQSQARSAGAGSGDRSAAARNGQRPVPKDQRGYLALYREHVTQANEGCDFDFLAHDHAAAEPEIF